MEEKSACQSKTISTSQPKACWISSEIRLGKFCGFDMSSRPSCAVIGTTATEINQIIHTDENYASSGFGMARGGHSWRSLAEMVHPSPPKFVW
jgi:hypothetical protein